MYVKILYVLIFLLLNQSYAYAYLEPGTLSIILQFIVGAFAAIIYYVAFYYKKVKNFLAKIFRKKKNKENN